MSVYLGNNYGARTVSCGMEIFTRDGEAVNWLQGDEANELEAQLDWVDNNKYPFGPFQSYREHFDALLDQYDYRFEERE